MKQPHTITITQMLGAVLLAYGAGLTARADYQATVVSQAPVGYYRLQESIAPPPPTAAANLGSLGAAASGSYTAYPSKGVAGALGAGHGTAVAFDGLSQWVQAPFSAELNPTAFTIEAWLKPTVAKPNGNLTCVMSSMHSASPRAGWLIYQSGGAPDTSGPGWELRMYAEAGTATSLRVLLADEIVAGTWYHVVFSYDGTNLKSYLNGQPKSSGTTSAFVPNKDAAFSVGARSDTGFPWAGTADEVAYYATALTEAQIKAHYDAATLNPGGYAGVVLANAPILYWRLDEPVDPPAANLGTLGAAGNGFYVSTAIPGREGPRAPTFPGFGGDNIACQFDGTAGFVNLPPLNLNSNAATITAWVKPTGVQPANGAIVFSRAGTTVAGLKFDAADPNGLSYNWNNDAAAYNFKSGLTVPAGQWSFVAMIVDPATATLCLYDGTSFNTAVNYDAIHGVQGFTGTTRIGSDSSDAALTFNGIIDEVAIFNRALGLGEVYSQYADAVGGKAPLIFGQPTAPAGTLFAGDTLSLSVDAGGSAPLVYQWRRNGSPIAGANQAAFVKENIVVSDSGNYDVVISNGSGSETSVAIPIAIEDLTPPTISLQPTGRTVYQGGTVVLRVEAAGGALAYEWQKGGTAIAGATGSSYTIESAVSNDAGDYRVVVSNRLGTLTSDTATVGVVVPADGSYEAAIVADGPQAWWRLDEAAGSLELVDAMGRHDGTFVDTVTLGAPGAVRGNSTALALDGNGYASVPFDPILNNADFTIECWAKTTVLDSNLSPMSTHASRKGCYFYTRSGEWSGGVGQDGANYYVPSETADVLIQSGRWVHLVLSYGRDSTGANNSLRYYVNGKWDGTGYVNFERNASGPLLIGARGVSVGSVDMLFNGAVDEVAVYTKALTTAEVLAHYNAGLYGNDTKPTFIAQPLSGAVLQGGSYSFSPQVEGSIPITYQWQRNGVAIDGATSATLTISNASASDAGTYKLVASNAAGTTESNPATLSVLVQPAGCNLTGGDLVLHLNFEDNYLDSSGRNNNGTAQGTPTFVAGAIGAKALQYNTQVDESGAVTAANYVSLGAPADLQFGTSQNFSISYWVRLPQGALPGDLPFFSNAENSYTNPGYTFAPSYEAGGWSWGLGSVGVYGPDGTINNGEWHHLLHTFDRAGNGITYLNGVRVDVRPAGSQDLNTGFDTCIGQDPTGTYAEAGEAAIDDIGVWRRVLTPEEALCIYAVGQEGSSFDTAAQVTLTLSYNGTELTLSWPNGTLQQADDVTGTWSDVTGANPPTYQVRPTEAKKFYRVKL